MPVIPPLALLLGPLGLLTLSVVFIVVAVAMWRLHAFVALMLAALLVALLSALGGGAMTLVQAAENVMTEFGAAAGKIGFVIALAAIIGACLLESGAAEQIVRRALTVLGEERAGLALMISGFVLSIPVFFDTVFFLLVPLAQALGRRTGRNYIYFLLAICAGSVVTHATVPPTPGPLLVAETLQVDMSVAMIGGVLVGILPALSGLWLARRLGARHPVPAPQAKDGADSAASADSALPPFSLSILPIALPVALISGVSFSEMIFRSQPAVASAGWHQAALLAGDKNIALLLGTAIAVWLVARYRGVSLRDLGARMAAPLETAGVIILITSAGGAYGAMIKNAGVGDSVRALVEGHSINYVLLAGILAAVVRVAQGSATVAMITTMGIMLSAAGEGGWGCHPFYIYAAIGYGATFLSWMNDSGFWIVGRLGGLSESVTLKTWSVLVSVIAVVGLLETWILSVLLPFAP